MLTRIAVVVLAPQARWRSNLAGTSSPTAQTGVCANADAPFGDPLAGPHWIGWGADPANTRFQSQKDAGISADEVPRLKLKWAFGFPDATQAAAQPSIAAGRVFVGSQKGAVYALDAATGCAHWSFTAAAGCTHGDRRRPDEPVQRVAPCGVLRRPGGTCLRARRGNRREALAGAGRRSSRGARDRSGGSVRITTLCAGLSVEEVAGARPAYECCRFRGSVVAFDAATGKVIWKSFAIRGEPRPTRKTPAGRQLWGPAGAAVWSSPTIDVKRRLIYVGTGNAYSEPAAKTSDAILAIDMATGSIRWSRQTTPNDVLRDGVSGHEPELSRDDRPRLRLRRLADPADRSPPAATSSWPGRSPVSRMRLDPDREGAIVWQFRAGQGRAARRHRMGDGRGRRARVCAGLSDVLRPAREAGGLFRAAPRQWRESLACAGARAHLHRRTRLHGSAVRGDNGHTGGGLLRVGRRSPSRVLDEGRADSLGLRHGARVRHGQPRQGDRWIDRRGGPGDRGRPAPDELGVRSLARQAGERAARVRRREVDFLHKTE